MVRLTDLVPALLPSGLNLLLAPLASEMDFVVQELNEENPALLGSAGAYAQAYSMFNGGLAAGMLAGPPWAGFIYSKTNWATMNGTLAVICVLGTVPVVCENFVTSRQFLPQADIDITTC